MTSSIEQKIKKLRNKYNFELYEKNANDMVREAILYGQQIKAEEVREKLEEKLKDLPAHEMDENYCFDCGNVIEDGLRGHHWQYKAAIRDVITSLSLTSSEE